MAETNLILPSKLSRRQMRKLFKGHFGVMRQITRETGVSESRITHWLLGHVVESPTVEAACRRKAAELLGMDSSLPAKQQDASPVSLNGKY